MNFKSLWILICAGALSIAPAQGAESWDGRILDVARQTRIGLPELASRMKPEAGAPLQLVLGEKHYTTGVQLAEARILRAVVEGTQSRDAFTLAWEFLNLSAATKIQDAFDRFTRNLLEGPALIQELFGRDLELAYLPLLEATRELGGELIPTNLSHAEKAPVVKNGVSGAPAGLIPEGFEVGGAHYFERFQEAMGGHGSPERMANYFAAQCLADDVMALHVLNDSRHPLRFLIVGSFHSDYNDGVVKRLRARAAFEKTVTIRIIDATDYSEAELSSLSRDPSYGELADYVYFVNEPSTP